jgi:alpha-galactosidase
LTALPLASLASLRLVVSEAGGARHERAVTGPGALQVGPVLVVIDELGDGWRWSVAVPGDGPVALTSVALTWDLGVAGPDPRLFCNGYQSWSASRVRRLGVDVDPSNVAPVPALVRESHHADPAVAVPGDLRSELVTVVTTGEPGAPLVLVGFLGGSEHDGTLRARLTDGRVAIAAEAHLGGALLAAGEQRPLHPVVVRSGDDASTLLAAWAADAGDTGRARTAAPFQVGWCSWYQWFWTIDEQALRANLALADEWPFDVFQLDDGYQRAIGDWTQTGPGFPSGLEAVSAAVAATGRTPGLWLAPFVVAPSSDVARSHPGWVVEHAPGRPLVGMVNEQWGGHVHVLDTTDPEVLAHLEATAADLVAAGFPYLKLDFTYAPSIGGRYADPSQTPAQRVRAGMEAVRRGAGDDTFLLGCGLPLGAGIGLVDGMRIGADVAPSWDLRPGQYAPGGYADNEPATVNAWRNTLTRSWMHRRLWLNDPDCLMLRTVGTELRPSEVEAWALAVGASGGMALVSDDLALLDEPARRLLDDVLTIGREVDAAAIAGDPPRCPQILDADVPTMLRSPGHALDATLDPVQASVT